MSEQPPLVARFFAQLERQGASTELAESPIAARLALVGSLRDAETKRVLAWPAEQLPLPGLLEALQLLGVEVVTPDLSGALSEAGHGNFQRRQQHLAGIEGAEVGLTGADAGFAATGTLLIAGGRHRSMLAGHLVRRHIVLLPASRLHPSLADWLAIQRQSGDLSILTGPTSVTLLSGPSRSRDIELSPALGVTGARQLHVIVIDEL